MKPMICETSIEPRWDEVWGVELYSHKGDEANSFGVFENVNLAYQPQFAATVLSLREELHSNWRTAL